MSKVEFTIDDIFGDSLNLRLDGESLIPDEIVDEINKSTHLVKATNKGIIIIDDELMAKVKKKNLSASMVSSIEQCPADWLMDSFILPLIAHEEPVYFARGHIFHKAMELFFTYDKEQRTPSLLSQMAMKVLKDDYKEHLENPETMNWVKEAFQGYLSTGFPYKDVDVALIKKHEDKDPELGIEIFVKGKLGNTQREVVGYVDRVDRLADGSLRIVDYKSGAKIHPFNPDEAISDSNNFGYWRQQLAYTMLLEQAGHKIGGAVLEFPIAKGAVEIDVNNEVLRRQVEIDFETADASLTKYIDENFFPFHGHFFCKWCGMLSPDFKASRYGKLNVSLEEVNLYVKHED